MEPAVGEKVRSRIRSLMQDSIRSLCIVDAPVWASVTMPDASIVARGQLHLEAIPNQMYAGLQHGAGHRRSFTGEAPGVRCLPRVPTRQRRAGLPR